MQPPDRAATTFRRAVMLVPQACCIFERTQYCMCRLAFHAKGRTRKRGIYLTNFMKARAALARFELHGALQKVIASNTKVESILSPTEVLQCASQSSD